MLGRPGEGIETTEASARWRWRERLISIERRSE
jgi:hypothetical protein